MIEKLPRIALIDVLRGFALLTMTVYHFTWDLEFFGWILPLTITEPGWVLFARAIASSFLILVGFSLVLAHYNGIRWRGFLIRLAYVVVAAAIISIATYFAFPNGLIFFGILHAIALFSLLGSAFLRLPWWLCLLAATAVFAIGQYVSHDLLSHPALWWVGLSPSPPVSNDYVPLFPWFSATLVGMALAKLFQKRNWLEKLATVKPPAFLQRPLGFFGRHSLIYYMIHQPLMLALIWSFTQVAGPPDRAPGFVKLCTMRCAPTRDEKFCRSYCACMGQSLKSQNLLTPFYDGTLDDKGKLAIDNIQMGCVAAQN